MYSDQTWLVPAGFFFVALMVRPGNFDPGMWLFSNVLILFVNFHIPRFNILLVILRPTSLTDAIY